jgi:protocatechuate 3,4-dioxygenase beta subunit
MRNRLLHILIIILIASTSALGQVPSQAKPVKNCAISGRVVNSVTNEAVKRANVILVPSGISGGEGVVIAGDEADLLQRDSSATSAITDQDGRFSFEKIPPGKYIIQVQRTGMTSTNARGRWRTGTQVSLDPAQEIRDLVLPLVPASAIAGRVLDQSGEPMSNAKVAALRYAYNGGPHRRLTPVGDAQTNDLGDYRIFGLAPGSYYLSVSTGAAEEDPTAIQQPVTSGPAKPRLRYPVTYYPGVINSDQAAPLKLAAGSEAHADFNLSAARSYRITGRVRGLRSADSKTVSKTRTPYGDMRAMLMLVSLATGGNGPEASARVGADSDSFEIRDVLPGKYVLVAYPTSASRENDKMGAPQQFAMAPLTVTGDMSNIELTMESMGGGEIRGRVTCDCGPMDKLDRLAVQFQPLNWREADEDTPEIAQAAGGYGEVSKDGTLKAQLMGRGNVRVLVTANGSNEGLEDYYTKSVTLGGRDVTDTGFSIATARSAPVEIIISRDGARVVGQALDAKDTPIANATVVLVPEQSRRDQMDAYATTKSDQKGHFDFRGVRPGNYTVYAWEDLAEEDGAYYYDDFLKQYKGEPVRLQSKDQQSISVRVNPATDSDE